MDLGVALFETVVTVIGACLLGEGLCEEFRVEVAGGGWL